MSNSPVFIIDSPINALVAAILAQNHESVEVIYAIDPKAKNEGEYLKMFRLILDGIKLRSEKVINYDSLAFWTEGREKVLAETEDKLRSIFTDGKTYFGNAFTNPVALLINSRTKLRHLYHSPADFSFLISRPSLREKIKNSLKAILGKPSSAISLKNGKIFTLADFKDKKTFEHVPYSQLSSSRLENLLRPMSDAMAQQQTTIMLLLSGSEPISPGDYNPSDMDKYIIPHIESVRRLMSDHGVSRAWVWMKEHKSYLPLTQGEKQNLVREFEKIGCEVCFASDYLGEELRLLPGECLFRYCPYTFVIGEPSSLLLNVTGGAVQSVASAEPFSSYRDANQLRRNREFLELNSHLVSPCRYY